MQAAADQVDLRSPPAGAGEAGQRLDEQAQVGWFPAPGQCQVRTVLSALIRRRSAGPPCSGRHRRRERAQAGAASRSGLALILSVLGIFWPLVCRLNEKKSASRR